MIARRDIRDEYEKKQEDLLARFKEELLGANVKLVADYEAIWKTIIAGKKVLIASNLTDAILMILPRSTLKLTSSTALKRLGGCFTATLTVSLDN